MLHATILSLVFALMPLAFLACGDGPDNPDIAADGTCKHTNLHGVDLLDSPIPVGDVQPFTHLQAFDFETCLVGPQKDRQAVEMYAALEVVIEELKANYMVKGLKPRTR